MAGLIILIIAGYSILLIYEFVPLYKQRLWHDFWVNAILGVLSFTVAILLCLDVVIPGPERPIREFITSIFGK
jgi:hypothetical protein